MSDANTQEPTMEEILASIRRIISEDDAPAAAASEAAAADEPGFEAEAAPAEIVEDDDVLDLTDPEPVAAAAPEAVGDIEASPRPSIRKPEPAAAPQPAPVPASADSIYEGDDDGLISRPAASQAATAFGQLSRTVAMPSEGRTIEDVIREMLRPMLKDWLDAHLSGIVETAVQAEVERISRQRRF